VAAQRQPVPPSEGRSDAAAFACGFRRVTSAIRLWGAGLDAGGGPVPDDAAQWVLDGNEVATGLEAFVDAPKPGDHRAALTVKTRHGSAEISIAFTTVELPEERDED